MKMKKSFYYIPPPLALTYFNNEQWSTSIRAENSLYLCRGFYPGIISFENGSSIIYAQKLNEYGYMIWHNPVLFHFNDTSYVGTGSMPPNRQSEGWINNGDGGVILFWYGFSQNNSIYAQRVDKTGKVKWHHGGLIVKESGTGMKFGGRENYSKV